MNCPYHETGKPLRVGKGKGQYCPNRGSGSGELPPGDSGYCQYTTDANGNLTGAYAKLAAQQRTPAAAAAPPAAVAPTSTEADARLRAASTALTAAIQTVDRSVVRTEVELLSLLGERSRFFYNSVLMAAYHDAINHPDADIPF